MNRSNCSRHSSVLYPFADAYYYEKISKREARLNTIAFQEAISLAAEYCQSEQSEKRREHIMKCLMMGALGRKKAVEHNKFLAEHRQNCLEAEAARKSAKAEKQKHSEAKAARKRSKEL